MIEYLTLAGVVLIGVGLALQGWFILDLNRRVTRYNGDSPHQHRTPFRTKTCGFRIIQKDF